MGCRPADGGRELQRTGVLFVRHSRSLAVTVELSLSSLLEAVAFFPQGLNEEDIHWVFRTISNVPIVFDKFCVLSLTYRTNGFVTMLTPLRDYLRPKDSRSSPLLNMTKAHYFMRVSGYISSDRPGFEEARWIMSEDVNVEYFLDVFATINPDSKIVWETFWIHGSPAFA